MSQIYYYVLLTSHGGFAHINGQLPIFWNYENAKEHAEKLGRKIKKVEIFKLEQLLNN